VHPVFALSANRSPLSLPTNRRPPTIAGCDLAELTPAKPNAHFSFKRDTLSAVSPPASPAW
jgi:hypothetical protein